MNKRVLFRNQSRNTPNDFDSLEAVCIEIPSKV